MALVHRRSERRAPSEFKIILTPTAQTGSRGQIHANAFGCSVVKNGKTGPYNLLRLVRTCSNEADSAAFMARSYYQIAIHHPGLCKHRVIRGANRDLVQAAAVTQRRAWEEQYARKIAINSRRVARENKRQELEDQLREAEERTAEAKAALDELSGVLAATLCVDDRVDWTAMMQPPFSQPRPKERPYIAHPEEPAFDPDEWRNRKNLVTVLVPFLAKRAEAAARAEFEAAHAKWQQRNEATKATNATIYAENLRDFEEWERRRNAHEETRANHNASIEQARTAYEALHPDAILDYCDLVLSNSQYPECFPKEFELGYRADMRRLVVDYRLPTPSDLPQVIEVKYVRSKREFTAKNLGARQFAEVYERVVCQVALRTLHELFEADAVGALSEVVFNGMVHGTNPATGHFEVRCIMSVCTQPSSMQNIDLRKINSRACFDSLGGLAAPNLGSMRSVTPLATINREEDRFSRAEGLSDQGTVSLNEWRGLVSSLSGPEDVRFLPLGTVAMLLGFPTEQKLTIRTSRELAEAVAARGFALEPDARYGGASYSADEEVALFRPLESAVTAAYPGAATLLRLCVMIAAADEHPTEDELEVARDLIRQNVVLTSQEQQRLLVLERYLCRNGESTTRSLAPLVKHLPKAHRQLVGEVLVCVAGADGVISSSEWKALDRVCKVLELPPSALDEILRKLGATFDEPTVQEAQPAAPGEPLPVAETAQIVPTVQEPRAFTLDMARVAAISRETAEVIDLLSSVMVEDQPVSTKQQAPIPVPPPRDPEPEASDWLQGLDEKYHAVAERIRGKSAWPLAEFQALAAEFKLMPLGIIDALNEWADEELGDFLLSGDDPVVVNLFILPKQP